MVVEVEEVVVVQGERCPHVNPAGVRALCLPGSGCPEREREAQDAVMKSGQSNATI